MAVASMHDEVVRPQPEEAEGLRLLEARLEAIAAAGDVAIVAGSGDDTAAIPASALEALLFVVRGMARGQTMVLMPHGVELTTQQAAELLHVSRPYLISDLLDTRLIPFHRVGTHRRVRIEDVLAYRDQRAAARRESLAELTRLSHDPGGGYR